MNRYLEAKAKAESLRRSRKKPEQLYTEGEEVGNLVVLQPVWNELAWMWSYKVSDLDGNVSEKMEWSLCKKAS